MQKNSISGLAAVGILLGGAIGAPAQGPVPAAKPPVVEVSVERPDGLYQADETIRFLVQFKQDGQPLAGKDLKYEIKGDGALAQSGELKTADKPQVIETRMHGPGILTCSVIGKDDASGKPVSGLCGAGVDVFAITPGMPMPADFDEYWKKTKAELSAVPVELLEKKEVPLPGYLPASTIKYFNDKGVKLYDIKIACAGGMPVSGYLALPAKMEKGKHPATVTFMGAPGHLALVWVPISVAEAGGIGLVINAHGHENGRDEKYIEEFRKNKGPWFGDDPDKIYVRGMALRALRALQYIKSLPEWNGRDLAVGGSSMGGGQALLAAALDDDISSCDAYVPTFCDWAGGLKQQRAGWPGAVTDPQQIKAAAYFDLVNLCKYIKAPTIIRTGFVDTLCASTGHYAVYNRMTCPKLIFNNPGRGHDFELLNPQEDTKKISAFRKEQKELRDKRFAGP